jgi:hypothetical protein
MVPSPEESSRVYLESLPKNEEKAMRRNVGDTQPPPMQKIKYPI